MNGNTPEYSPNRQDAKEGHSSECWSRFLSHTDVAYQLQRNTTASQVGLLLPNDVLS